jgi:hypothetical protein
MIDGLVVFLVVLILGLLWYALDRVVREVTK